jgi:hypothetical protein
MDPVLPLSPYSPECVEGEFSEVRHNGVLRSCRLQDDSLVTLEWRFLLLLLVGVIQLPLPSLHQRGELREELEVSP